MVIGSGMIATRFAAYKANNHIIIYASGVADSSSTNESAYKREKDLLQHSMEEFPAARLVYFSTCSIYDPSLQQSRYVQHKLQMEELIQSTMQRYLILRVSNPVGHTSNRHTVLNFFIDKIVNQESFEVWSYASRNLIDLDHMFLAVDALIKSAAADQQLINIANPVNYPVTTIISTIENHFGKPGKYTLINKGNSPLIDTTLIQPLFAELQVNFSPDYLQQLLKKYYPV